MGLILQAKANGDFKPHPEGIHPAVCVDVIELGLREEEFQGRRKMVEKVRVVFESEQKLDDGRNCIISKNFTASLHPKARLAEFLGKWRGRPVLPDETINLGKLVGACCTLVISHQQNAVGQTYAAIDAVSKPTKKLVASGYYDPAAARQRIEEWKSRQGAGEARDQRSEVRSQRPARGDARTTTPTTTPPKSAAAPAAAARPQSAGPSTEFDPEVGF
jgi:hypothetical protein